MNLFAFSRSTQVYQTWNMTYSWFYNILLWSNIFCHEYISRVSRKHQHVETLNKLYKSLCTWLTYDVCSWHIEYRPKVLHPGSVSYPGTSLYKWYGSQIDVEKKNTSEQHMCDTIAIILNHKISTSQNVSANRLRTSYMIDRHAFNATENKTKSAAPT